MMQAHWLSEDLQTKSMDNPTKPEPVLGAHLESALGVHNLGTSPYEPHAMV